MITLSNTQIRQYVIELRRHVIALTGRPISVKLSRFEESGHTDCVRSVCLTLRYLERGLIQVTRGIATHESGHILYSPWGSELMARANKANKSGLPQILNLILDRKDDFLIRRNFPGAVADLNSRLPHIAPRMTKEEREENPYFDFFRACKCSGRPMHACVWKSLEVIREELPSYREATLEQVWDCALRVHAVLGEDPQTRGDRSLLPQFILAFRKMEEDEAGIPQLDKKERKRIFHIIASVEKDDELELFPEGSDTGRKRRRPPGSSGRSKERPGEELVAPAPEAFAEILEPVAHLVAPLVRSLEFFDEPDIEIVRGLEAGQLDPLATARIALGMDDVHLEEHIQTRSRTLALALDSSSSMKAPIHNDLPSKFLYARQLGVVFNAALAGLNNSVANSWHYDSRIHNCGPASRVSGIAGAEASGSNCDTAMADMLLGYFRSNPAERMMAVFISDSGPDNMEEFGVRLAELRAQGVVTVQLFIESEDFRDSSEHARALDQLKSLFDHQLVFGSDTIDSIVHAFCVLLHRLYAYA